MEWALDGPMVRLTVIVLCAVAINIGLVIIFRITLPEVHMVTRKKLQTALLMAAIGVLVYVGFWVL